MSPFFAALFALPLLASIPLPCGEIRRSSLFGYRTEAGAVLDLEEAAELAALQAAPPPPAPAGKAMANPYRLPSGEVLNFPEHCTDARERFTLRGGAVVWAERVSESEPAPTTFFLELESQVAPANDDAEQLAVAEPPADQFEDDFQPAEAVVRVCDVCKGGQRHPRGGCPRCDGRLVRAWVNNREVTPWARCRDDAERLGVVNALSDLFPDLDDRVRQGAMKMFGIATTGISTAARSQALWQWLLARQNEAFRAEIDGAPPAQLQALQRTWGDPDAALRGSKGGA